MKKREAMEKLNKMSEEDLLKELEHATKDALMAKLNIESRKSEKTSEFSKKRKYIAQINTVLNTKA
jgi:ribosomal protein L29